VNLVSLDFLRWLEGFPAEAELPCGRCPLEQWSGALCISQDRYWMERRAPGTQTPAWAATFIRLTDGIGWSARNTPVERHLSTMRKVMELYTPKAPNGFGIPVNGSAEQT
jgi:hypothetical protein